jgi:hypothetical protein
MENASKQLCNTIKPLGNNNTAPFHMMQVFLVCANAFGNCARGRGTTFHEKFQTSSAIAVMGGENNNTVAFLFASITSFPVEQIRREIRENFQFVQFD